MRYTVLAAVLTLAAGAGTTGSAHAGEGLWTPQQLSDLAAPLKSAGLKLNPKQFADMTGDPMGAVVTLGGCTASFVSPKGLVLTNHHCAYGAIQLNSTPQKNLLLDGFHASTVSDEIPAGPNVRIYALESTQDVTAQVQAAIAAAADPQKRVAALEQIEKQLVTSCEAQKGYGCRLHSFAGGAGYRLFRSVELQDVRLVYAPPESIGNFGGEADNWMWPRHTGDFVFYRAYVGRDGKPAPYSPDNVPYTPRRWLKMADKPLGAGDFVMAVGYPALTNRHPLAEEFDNSVEWTYPVMGGHYRKLAAVIEAEGRKNPETAAKYASSVRGWQGAARSYESQLDIFRRLGTGQAKHAEENAVLEWLRGQGAAGEPALAAHRRLVELDQQANANRERDLVLGQLSATGAIGAATQLYRLSIERAKPDGERTPGYRQQDLAAFEAGLKQMDRRYDPMVDRELQAYWLREYLKLPQAQHVEALDKWLGGSDEKVAKRALDKLTRSRLRNAEPRLAWFNSDRAAFEKSRDSAIQVAVAMMPTLLKIEDEVRTRAGESLMARPVYLQAMADYEKSQGRVLYPDANGSLRAAFGKVTGYSSVDGAKLAPFTRLDELAARSTGQAPFNAPPKLLAAVKDKRYGGLLDKRLGTVPVNFVADLDIAGGSSGSPVLDAQGKLVGLVFDSNRESVGSNWVFDPAMTRTICVDQRYIRWVMQELYPAPGLLAELGVPLRK